MPLQLACMHRAPKDVFRLLFVLGADINTQCHRGRTPLHYYFPNQDALPSVYEEVMSLIADHSLPTITPLDKPTVHLEGGCQSVEAHVRDFTAIIGQLLSRHADMSTMDHERNDFPPCRSKARLG